MHNSSRALAGYITFYARNEVEGEEKKKKKHKPPGTTANKQAETEVMEKQAEKATLLCLDTYPT